MARRGRPRKVQTEAAAVVETKPQETVVTNETPAVFPELPANPEPVVEPVKAEQVASEPVPEPIKVEETVAEAVPETVKVEEEAKPVSVIVPTAEVKEPEVIPNEEPVQEPAKESEEPSSEAFIADLPKVEEVKNVVETPKPEVKIMTPPPEKKVIKSKPLEYPPSAVPMMNKLRKNPAYARLTDAALIRIASSKLRSRYFFG